MYPAGNHPLFPYTEEERHTVLQKMGISENDLKLGVEAIQDWIQKQPHLADAGISSNAAAFSLLMAKGSVERVKQRTDIYYKERSRSISEKLERFKILTQQHRPICNTFIVAPIPKLYNGMRITFIKVCDWNNFSIEDLYTCLAMTTDIRMENDFMTSEIWVIDLNHPTLPQVMSLNFMTLHKMLNLATSGIGIRYEGIHVVNISMASIIQPLINICKQYMPKKTFSRLKFHVTSNVLLDFIPKEYLIEDYGGNFPSYEVYKEKFESLFFEDKTKQFLLDACNIVSDESKRPKSEDSEDYLMGSFKKLDFD